jgi:lipid A 3-O-deacylase
MEYSNVSHAFKKVFGKLMIRGAAAIVVLGAAPFGFAQTGISMHYGKGKTYQRLTAGYELSPVWTRSLNGKGRLDLVPEVGVSYWFASGEHRPKQAWQANAIPMFRWWMSPHFYVEGGIGPTVFSRTRFADKTISTAFQFGDHVGLGVLVKPQQRIGMRYSHFSNASIKRPNPGLDIVQFTYTYEF